MRFSTRLLDVTGYKSVTHYNKQNSIQCYEERNRNSIM